MALPVPPSKNQPIPNNPFYYPEGNFLYGDTGHLIVGAGLSIDYTSGVISASGGGGGVSSILAGTGINVSSSTGNVTITNTGVISISTGLGLSGGPITSTGTITLSNTGVNPGNYTLANITVDAQGRISAASNGTAVLSVSGTAPVNVTTGVNPTISIAPSSTSSAGIVQLNNTLSSNSTTEALTAAQGQILQNQINSLSVATNLTFAGTFDATLGHMDSVTAEGTAEGFTLGANLPAPASSNDNFFVIVTTEGLYSPPGGGGPYAANRGDWFLSNGVTWEYLNVGADLPVASTGSQGIVELATVAETQAGTSTTLAVTPAGLAATYVSQASLCNATPTVFGLIQGCSTSSNTSLGCNALLTGTGSGNIAIGVDALCQNSTGVCNTVMGIYAMRCNISGSLNVALGLASMAFNTTGGYNTAVGSYALNINCSGCRNTATGALALGGNRTGCNNSAFGNESMYNNVSGCNNSAFGFSTIVCANTACFNSAFGAESLCRTNIGSWNTAVGACSMFLNTSGTCNTAVGFNSLCCNNGTLNTAVGIQALLRANSSLNSAFGGNSLACTTTGQGNTGIGACSLGLNTSGSFNVAIGLNSACALTSGNYNVIIGQNVQAPNPTGSCQLAVGFAAGCCWLTGCSDRSIKPVAGIRDCTDSSGSTGCFLCSTGSGVRWSPIPVACIGGLPGLMTGTTSCGFALTALGVNALRDGQGTTSCNTAIGQNTLTHLTSGLGNVAVGMATGYCQVSGNFNTYVGVLAGLYYDGVSTSSGSNNVLLGACACLPSPTASNTITLGNFSITALRSAVTTITSLSDARDKTNVTALPVGLDFVNSLNPVKFTWQQREPNEVKDGTSEAGFIAQELQAAELSYSADYLGLVYDENPDKLEASPGKLIPVLVKAIQELSAKVDELEAKLAANG